MPSHPTGLKNTWQNLPSTRLSKFRFALFATKRQSSSYCPFCASRRLGFFSQIDPGLSGSNAKQLASVPHMTQLSAESTSRRGIHQRKFASWLGGIAKERADNGFRKGSSVHLVILSSAIAWV
jgi:hypothetical protein